jgi:hypothetical protein
MKIKEINGRAIKKALNCRKASFRYHNKNTRGGNFGFEVRGVKGLDFEISGNYNNEGFIYGLCVNILYEADINISLSSFNDLVSFIERYAEKKNLLFKSE